ncbi:MAG: endo-1,4-beta-xylanase [Oscillospiraceae bacterium]|nr:endo-1,4-beta-xylanase [Oscillospiraceae bacterium]
MHFKKIAAGITALACCVGMVSLQPFAGEKTYAAELVCNDFEVTYDGWYGNSDYVKLDALDEAGFDASRGMVVSGRQVPADGASSSKGFYLEGGVDYSYSVKVFSESDEKFNVTLLCKDMDTDECTEAVLFNQEVQGGKWTELKTNYKAPKGSYYFNVSITTDSTNDFSFDDFYVTQKVKSNSQTINAASANQGLKDEFAHYFRVGSVLNGGTVKDSSITANMIKNFNSITCENEMKPDATLVQSQSSGTNVGVSLNSAASILDFCSKNGIGVRGHTLVWHSQTPEWFFKENFQQSGAWVSSSTMDVRMESYIKNMFQTIQKQYPSLNLYAYDVANECVSDDSNRTANNGGARVPGYGDGKSPWVQVYGNNSFLTKAFTYARKYAPATTKLYYNDYNEYWDHKRDCIASTCEDLYKKGILDGIGMQSHINADSSGFSGTSAYITAMKKFAAIGCDVQCTELDISIEGGKFSLQQQAEKYKAIFQAAMDLNSTSTKGKVRAICVWGPNDANTWIKTENAPLLFDTNNQAKPAYNTLIGMLPESQWGDGKNPTDGGTVAPIEPNEYGWYFQDGFEGTTGDWAGRGDAAVQTSGRTAYVGSESLLVSGRTSAWNGAAKSLSPSVFKPGTEYSFSSNVMYLDGGATDTFYMKLQYVDSAGETNYSTIAEATAINGSWVQLANTKYMIPEDASDMQLYVETADSTNNFYVDEVIGAVAGTSIKGAGESKKITLGDVDCDGNINSLDFVLIKNGFLYGIDDAASKIAADVDQSGVFDVKDALLLQSYLLGKIDVFPVAEKVIDTAAMEAKFSGVTLASSYKKDGENNPLYTQRFGADPGFMVYKDRIYVYTTNDAFEYDSNGKLKENSYDVGTINCCSSADLVNWTDHGAIPVAGKNGRTQGGAASWAFASWAPDACWKTINGKDKFFLYFANSGGGIGVLTADSPTGPWTDPLGHALVTGQSPNCGDVVWMFDPGVMVDDDGTGYLYFGGGVDGKDKSNPKTGRCVKLGADMISLAGTPVTMETPYLFEDSSIIKIGDTYYYSYCSNWDVPGGTQINGQSFNSGDICYMTSKNPLGPWTKSQFGGMVFRNTGAQGLDKGGNNHHSIVEFKGKYYVLYHTRVVENRMGITQNYRSPSISEATISNGKITCKGSHTGVSQLETLSPYSKIQAETMSNQSSGITVSGVGDTTVSAKKGNWIKVSGVDFKNGCTKLTVNASSKTGSAIKICTGSPSGTVVGYVDLSTASGGLKELTVPVKNLSSTQDIYFVFSDETVLDWWSFS